MRDQEYFVREGENPVNNTIYQKLLNIQNSLKAPKGQYNLFGKYYYRNCEDILEAVKPLLKDNNCTLVITDSIENIGNRFYVKAIVKLTDIETDGIGNIEVSAYAREEESKKGMDGSQVTGASSSYARKYALNGLFAIDDTKDSDTTNKDENGKLTDAQVKRLFAIAKNKSYDKASVKESIMKNYKKTIIEELTKKEYDEICNKLEELPDKLKGVN